MRTATLLALFALFLPACGGGSSGTTLQSAALQGTVVELDGQALDRSGVFVTLMETGETQVTDVKGTFQFRSIDPGTYTVDFDARFASATLQGNEDDYHDGEVEDDEGRPRVDVPPGGDVDIEVVIEDGEVKDWSVGDHEERHAVAYLHLTDEGELAGFRVEGKIRISSEDAGDAFSACVWGLDAGDVIEIKIGDVLVGDAQANEEGEACFGRFTGEGETLPLSVENVTELSGRRLEVCVGDTVVLVGEIPDLPAEKEPPHEGDGEDGNHEVGGDDNPGEGDGHEEGGDGAGEGDGGDNHEGGGESGGGDGHEGDGEDGAGGEEGGDGEDGADGEEGESGNDNGESGGDGEGDGESGGDDNSEGSGEGADDSV